MRYVCAWDQGDRDNVVEPLNEDFSWSVLGSVVSGGPSWLLQ
jgi:hypothetical protein